MIERFKAWLKRGHPKQRKPWRYTDSHGKTHVFKPKPWALLWRKLIGLGVTTLILSVCGALGANAAATGASYGTYTQSVRCRNAADTAFESCGGSSSTSGTIAVTSTNTVVVAQGALAVTSTSTVVSLPAVSAPTIAKVGATGVSAQLIASNSTRKGIEIATDCANTDAVAINFGASAAVYASHLQLPPCVSWAPPPGLAVTSAIQVISNSGTQNVRVTEYP